MTRIRAHIADTLVQLTNCTVPAAVQAAIDAMNAQAGWDSSPQVFARVKREIPKLWKDGDRAIQYPRDWYARAFEMLGKQGKTRR
jgi:hypothetical protein